MKETDVSNTQGNVSPEDLARAERILNEGFDPFEDTYEQQKKEVSHKEKSKAKQRFRTEVCTDVPVKILALAYNLANNTNLTNSGVVNEILKKFLEENEEVRKKVEKILKI